MAKSARKDNKSGGYSGKVESPALGYGHYSNELSSSQLNEIEEEEHSEANKSIKNERAKYSYLMSKHEEEDLEEEARKNIEYLGQTSSVIYNKSDLENEGFSGSKEDRQCRVRKWSSWPPPLTPRPSGPASSPTAATSSPSAPTARS